MFWCRKEFYIFNIYTVTQFSKDKLNIAEERFSVRLTFDHVRRFVQDDAVYQRHEKYEKFPSDTKTTENCLVNFIYKLNNKKQLIFSS